jgi:hypothetical protein
MLTFSIDKGRASQEMGAAASSEGQLVEEEMKVKC